jgi:hypothetical protein
VLEPVVWEVSSGRWNPPADEWLAGDSASRIEAPGFATGGNAENYHRTVGITTPADAAAVAKQVVRIFYDGFDYRGAQPVVARLAHEGRSETKATYDAFTPEDVARVFAGLGYARVRFEAEVELPDEERQRLKAAPDAPEGAEPIATMSVVHAFSGGVTLDWLIARIGEWDAMLREHRRMARTGRSSRRVPAPPAAETVH